MALSFAFSANAKEQEIYEGDIVIYGGTSGAVIAAIRAAKSGKKVYMVSPDVNLGAMSSSGLGMTDSGNTAAIGGLSREFYKRVYAEYKKDANWYAEKRSEFSGSGQVQRQFAKTTKLCGFSSRA